MKAHELAKKLLEMPDLEVWGIQTGQGSCERQDEPLFKVNVENPYLMRPSIGEFVWLHFGESE